MKRLGVLKTLSRRFSRALIVVAVLPFGSWAPGAAAVPPAAAASTSGAVDPALQTFRRAIDEAFAHKEAGRHLQALAAFQRALGTIRARSGPAWDKRRFGVMYQQALVLAAVERLAEARRVLEVMRDLPGLAEAERETISEAMRDVERRLAERQRARAPVSVAITIRDRAHAPLGAHVTLAGVELGAAPVMTRRVPGDYPLEVRLEGYLSHREVLVVQPEKPLAHTVVLVPAPERPAPDYAPAWATGAVGLALLIGGGVLHGLADGSLEASRQEGLWWPDAHALRERGDKQATAAWALYGLGGAALISGITVGLVQLAREQPPSQAAVSVSLSPRGGGATLRTRF